MMVVVAGSEVKAELGSVYYSFFFLRIVIVLLVTIYMTKHNSKLSFCNTIVFSFNRKSSHH